MTRPELGTKRVCPNCGAKYYDLNKRPITCPRCGTSFDAPATKARAAAPAPVEEDDVPVLAEAAEGVEFISLEEADEEAAGPAGEEDEEVEIAGGDADPFLEEADEEEDDVTGIIGGVEDGDEEP